MKKIILFCLMAVFLAGCSQQSTKTADVKSPSEIIQPDPASAQKYETAPINQQYLNFTSRLSSELMKDWLESDDMNFGYSPSSLAIPVSIAMDFSKGSDREKIFAPFDFSAEQQLSELAGAFQFQIVKDDYKEEPAISLHNSFWLNKKFSYDKKILEKYANAVDSPIYISTFDADTSKEYSLWQKDVLGEEMNPKTFEPNSFLLLANALKFSGQWKNPFQEEDNIKDVFYNADGHESNIEYMVQKQRSSYVDGEKYKALIIPMEFDFETLVIVPKKGYFDEVAKNIEQIKEEVKLKLITSSEISMVHLYLPKFQLETKKDISSTLAKGLLKDLFIPYNNALSSESINIQAINQFTSCDVNEKGMDIKALTEVLLDKSAIPMEVENSIDFKVNQPFIFCVDKLIYQSQDTAEVNIYTGLVRELPNS